MLNHTEIFRLKSQETNGEREINIGTTIYKVDSEGYLLDDEAHYLLNDMGLKLRL